MVYERVTESAYIISVLSIVILLFCGQNLPAVKPLVRLKITFLCMGAYAATYHADKDCPALKQCQGKVKYIHWNRQKDGTKTLPSLC